MKHSLNEETVPIYLKSIDDCYLRELEVKVIGVEKDGYVFDKTIMHYEGGGQPGDRGFFEFEGNKIRITNVIKRGNKVIHIINQDIIPATEGKLILDWERRYEIMKMHTLQHAISAILFDKYQIKTVSSNVYNGYGEIIVDKEIFKFDSDIYNISKMAKNVKRYTIQRENLNPSLLKRCNLERLPKSLSRVSIVEIEGLDKCACAGTHVKNTSEIGNYWIRSTGKRIEFGKF